MTIIINRTAAQLIDRNDVSTVHHSILTTNINPSGVHNLPHLNSPTTILSTPENSPVPENSSNNSNQNSDEEFLNIAGRSIFDHEKVH